ncbi:MAG: Lrp/AsnC family transcriptional regulator [Candidatus Omnitrophota bacterium]|nr:Lrp/AsnC family transcriptional regulator [Candidatus Omnitrophota bacterium]
MGSTLDKKIISLISRDIPLTKEPFKDLADRLGIKEQMLLERIRSFKKNGLMRKLCAILNHRKIGFQYNAMVVWNVPEKLIDKAGSAMSSFDEVSHCYQREKRNGWNYNLYSMIHGRTKRESLAVVKKISGRIGPDIDYRVLFSSGEEKKIGAKYFA